ncbi:hypothetical protein CPC16_006173 [Podila verticillata]|nr:hypothetical protein CPC16_006173 [Podila verticillata]
MDVERLVTSELNMSSPVQYTLTDMKDMATLDFAFVFKQPTIHSQVAIWTHQDVLASSIQLANYFMTPNKVYGRSGPRRYSISFVRVSYCLLESYCAMIRFLYSGQLALEIDLREFVLTSTAILSPDKQLLVRSAVVEGTLVKPLRETTWDDVYKLAMGFEMKSLKARCLEKVAPIIPKPVPLTLAQRGLAHLQNAESVDFAFVFKFPANNPRQKDHLVGLWSDQFTLATTSIEFKKFHRLVEQANWTLTPGSFSTTTNQVCEFSLLVPYCALLQYIYTGVLELKIDLSNFVITAMSVQPEQQRLERIFIDELKAGPRKVVPLLEVSQLAKKYGPRELAKQCKERLQSPMSPIVVLAESNTRERGNLLRLA